MDLQPLYSIRELRQEDDFERVCNLMANRQMQAFPRNPDRVRSLFFPREQETRLNLKGFVAEAESKIIAFMSVELRGKDGHIMYFIEDQDSQLILSELLERCAQYVIESGGERLTYFVFTEFGQIYNREIARLDRLGFQNIDPYLRVSARLLLNEWNPPEHLDTESIQTESLSLDEIYRMLLDDDSVTNAYIFKFQFRTVKPSNVVLTMRNTENEIIAVAYYKVIEKPNGQLLGAAFNVHFRPKFELPRAEKRRFLQGA
ncbi:MAG: hypothetical protein K0Q73_6986, partial [Paenibacillus sp.]|nr:hypothetical protein [Paenibacillus sp.]